MASGNMAAISIMATEEMWLSVFRQGFFACKHLLDIGADLVKFFSHNNHHMATKFKITADQNMTFYISTGSLT